MSPARHAPVNVAPAWNRIWRRQVDEWRLIQEANCQVELFGDALRNKIKGQFKILNEMVVLLRRRREQCDADTILDVMKCKKIIRVLKENMFSDIKSHSLLIYSYLLR